MLRAPAVAPHHVLPVCVEEHHIVHITHIERVAVNPLVLVCLGKRSVANPCVVLVGAIVAASLKHAVGPFVEAHQLCRQTDMLVCVRAVVVHFHLAGLGLLGGDKHNAAGSLATVDRSGSVLKEVHTLDIGGVDESEVVDTLVFHSVDDDQRCGSIGRHGAAKCHIPAFVAGSRRVTGDDDTRHLALESLHGA